MPTYAEALRRFKALDPTEQDNYLKSIQGRNPDLVNRLLSDTGQGGGGGWFQGLLDVPVLGDVVGGVATASNWWQDHIVEPIEAGVWRGVVGIMPGEQSGEANLEELGTRGAFRTAQLPIGMKTGMDIGFDPMIWAPGIGIGGAVVKGVKTGAQLGIGAGLKTFGRETIGMPSKVFAKQPEGTAINLIDEGAKIYGQLPEGATGAVKGWATGITHEFELPPSVQQFKTALKEAQPSFREAQQARRADIAAGRSQQVGKFLNAGEGAAKGEIVYRQGIKEGHWWSPSFDYVHIFGKSGKPINTGNLPMNARIINEDELIKLMNAEERTLYKGSQKSGETFSQFRTRVEGEAFSKALDRLNYDAIRRIEDTMEGFSYTSYYIRKPSILKGELYGVDRMKAAFSSLGGELSDARFAMPEIPKNVIDDVAEFILEHPVLTPTERMGVAKSFLKVINGVPITGRKEIKQFGRAFGDDAVAGLLAQRGFSGKVIDLAADVANFPRAVMASWDFSAPLRQGLFFQAGRFKESLGSYLPMFKAWKSEKNMIAVHEAMETHRLAKTAKESGLFMAELPTKKGLKTLTAREEAFLSPLAEKMPVVLRSNRAYVTYLNKVRFDIFTKAVEGWEKAGRPIFKEDLKSLANLINVGTGRGKLGPLNKYGAELSAVLFAPRLQMARLELPTLLFRATPLVRKEFIRDSMAILGAQASILGGLKMAGIADVELDPRSSDFGKVKVGNTRFDIWGGNQQYARLIAMLVAGEAKAAGGGSVYDIPAKDVLTRFAQGKLSPIASLVTDLVNEKDFLGEEFGIYDLGTARTLKERLLPMVIQDIIDTAQQSGPLMAVAAGATATFGVGVSSYGKGTWQEVRSLREDYNDTGKDWADLTNAEKRDLEDVHPDLKELTTSLTKDLDKFVGSDIQKTLQQIENTKDEQFKTKMEQLAQSNATWQQYNDVRDRFLTERYAITEIAYDMQPALTGQSLEDIEKRIRENSTPQDNAMRDYKAIMSTPLVYDINGMPDWDSKFAEADKFLQSLDAETRAYIQTNEHAWINDLPADAQKKELQRYELVAILKPYWEIRGNVLGALTADQQKKLKEYDDKRRQMAAEGNYEWEKMELMRDPYLAYLVKKVERSVSDQKSRMRKSNKTLDAAVSTWYLRFSDLG